MNLFPGCPMLERSSIDLLSNHTILRDFTDPFDIAMMALGKYPPGVLPQFTHELTHHWCFNSPVGFALAFLELEATAIMVSGKVKDPAVRMRVRDCLLKATVARSMLRPIAEGMSLFAEFDVMV